jgi:ketosteroid isomerase-like protein
MMDAEIGVMESILIGAPDPEIIALEERLRAAQLDADGQALDQLISDDLLFTGPDGNLATKSVDINAHQSGLIRFRKHEPEELKIRRVGADVAIVALRVWLEVEVSGNVISGTYRYTRVWAREGDGNWRVVGGQVSEISHATTDE